MTDSQNTSPRLPMWALFLLVIIAGGFFVYGKTMENRDRSPTMISVSGEGKVFGRPDIAELTFGVQTGRKQTAKEAMAILQRNTKAIIEAVTKLGIDKKDIRNEQFSLYPAYDWREGQQIPRGFEATQTLRVKVRDLDKVGEALGAATNAGANQVGGVSFSIDDPDLLRSEAREEAITEAKSKAQRLASDLGMRLGKLKGFSEGGGSPPMPYAMDAAENLMRKVQDQSAPELPPGQEEVRINVTMTYELK